MTTIIIKIYAAFIYNVSPKSIIEDSLICIQKAVQVEAQAAINLFSRDELIASKTSS
jgi:hypothetical protein